MILSVHFDNKNKDILILADGPTHLLDNTTLIYPVKRNICICVDFNPIDTNDILDLHKCLIKGT